MRKSTNINGPLFLITTYYLIFCGVLIVEVTPKSHPLINLRKLKGYLGLQNHGGGVNFRNLRIGPAAKDFSFAKTTAKGKRKTAKTKLKPLSKPVKVLFPGTWNVQPVVDREKLSKELKVTGASEKRIAETIGAVEKMLKDTKIRVLINPDGTSVSTVNSRDLAGKEEKDVENERWKILKSTGRSASIQFTRTTKGKESSRTVKITFLSDDAFRLDEDPDLKSAPFKKPIFQRSK